jgi:integrase
MGRPASGSIRERLGADGNVTFTARFTAYGKRQTARLGTTLEGWTRSKAEQELAYILADVRRGTWTPGEDLPAAEPINPEVPTFHVFASEWFAAEKGQWKPATQRAYLAELRDHLLPFFGDYRLDEIDVALVDRYRETKVAEGRIGARYINKTITKLQAILDVADERELIDRNPCRINPKRRRIRNVPKARTPYLDRAEQIDALIRAAGQLDAEARDDRRALNRRALLSVLTYGGLRIAEALDLRWRDVDLPNGRLAVPGTKTDAADREFRMLPVLAAELRAARATATRTDPDALVFATATGKPQDRTHTLSRVLKPAIKRANEELAAKGYKLIPLGEGRGKSLTQHGLRHTHISLRGALGDPFPNIAEDVGQDDLETTLRIYTHAMKLDDGAKDRLQALVNGEPLPDLEGEFVVICGQAGDAAEGRPSETPTRPAGFEPAASRSGGERSIH